MDKKFNTCGSIDSNEDEFAGKKIIFVRTFLFENLKFMYWRNVAGFSSFQLAPFVICDMTEFFLMEVLFPYFTSKQETKRKLSLSKYIFRKAKRKGKVQSEIGNITNITSFANSRRNRLKFHFINSEFAGTDRSSKNS